MEEGRSVFKILTGKPIGKKHLGRPRSRLEDNARIDLKETCVSTRNRMDSVQDMDYWSPFVNTAHNFRFYGIGHGAN